MPDQNILIDIIQKVVERAVLDKIILFGSRAKDEHLNIGEGDYDFNYLLQCVMRGTSGLVTVETPRIHKGSLDEDIQNVLILKGTMTV